MISAVAIPDYLNVACIGSFVTLHYCLSGPQGNLINTFGGRPSTLSLGSGELSPALEDLIIGLSEGAHVHFELPAGVAFGERKIELQQWVARTLLDKFDSDQMKYAVGDVIQFPTPDGKASYAGTVISIKDTAVQFDFNHPLAGQPVRFEIKLIAILSDSA